MDQSQAVFTRDVFTVEWRNNADPGDGDKPPYKLPVQTIRKGFRPIEFWQEIIKPDTIPANRPERQRYNSARLAGSVAVQQFYRMVEYGVGCSSITNGLIDVQLWVPFDDLTTLYYDVGGLDINIKGPRTRVERALYAYLMSFRASSSRSGLV
ncbi:hypothetical protein BDV59DRAFT_1783 [Aspergillus ambiguus]|uniref:uncharacterized protein n=1 Tax=Aspergillus ambiguus TaxID=176160 RepID=UPI003CCCFBB1